MSVVAAIKNTLSSILREPQNASIIGGKVIQRLRRGKSSIDHVANHHWMAQHSVSSAEIAAAIDPDAWHEAQDFERALRERAGSIINSVPIPMATGGAFSFLYWLIRVFTPHTVVETGVAAGFTSASILAALEKNGGGRLFSSDFPYFRHPNPEKYIGILVEPELRKNWSLSISGDAKALPKIIEEVDRIDLLHYDSDKSYAGRDFAMKLVLPKLSPDGLIIMDDIWNDSWFHDFVTREKRAFVILDKRYGVIGAIEKLRIFK